jgi:hypothetical protein
MTVLSDNATMGKVNGSGDYVKNSNVSISAIPNPGYEFVKWKEDNNTTNPRTIMLIQGMTYTAEFALSTYSMTVSANTTMGTVTGSGDYVKGSSVTIGAVAKPGYEFVQWNDNNTDNPRTITALTQNTTFTATFAVSIYSMTVSANNTTMGAVTGSGNYAKDSLVTIGAIPNQGYEFVQWNDGIKTNPRTITLTQNATFTATFDVSIYSLTVSAPFANMGTVVGGGDYAKDSLVTIGAIPNPGYEFIEWNDGNTDNPRTITLTQNTIFTATFAVSTYAITVSVDDATMGAVIGGGDYAKDGVVSIGAIPNPGYEFAAWNDGETDNPRTITLTEDTNFVATFTVSTYAIDLSVDDATMGTVTDGGDYAKNEIISIGAIPNQGYEFVQWNDGETDNPRTVTLTQDTNFVATFAVSQNTYHVGLLSSNTTMGSVAGSGDYAKNSMVTIGAIANQGYQFVEWSDGNNQNPRSFTLTSDIDLTAEFSVGTGVKSMKTTSMSIYPNPATDNIQITLPENVPYATFTLYDAQGKELIRKEVKNQDKVSVSNFAAGVYIYNVITTKESYTGKLVIKN